MAASVANTNIPVNSWPNNEAGYDLIEVIGVGATAVVFSAFCEARNEKCAIKRINLDKWNTSMDELLKEIHAMSFCNHENVVTYYTSFVVKEELWLILKLLEGNGFINSLAYPPGFAQINKHYTRGSLLDVVKHKMRVSNCKNGVFDEATIATVLKEVLKGLEYFHSNGQIHRDIKAGNILLGEDGTVQIADFGVSAWLSTGRDSTKQKVRHTFVGTPCWMAPEVMDQDHGYDFKADIWSFGITAIEMATGTAPYHKFPPMKVLMLTLQNDPPGLDTSSDDRDQYKAYGKTFRKMILECLQKNPAKRPTASELLKHSFFKKAKDRKYLTQTLVAIGPTMETRVHKASRRQQGSSGRLHRSASGEWIWSDSDEEEVPALESESEEEPFAFNETLPLNKLQRADSSDDEDNEKHPKEKKVIASKLVVDLTDAEAKIAETLPKKETKTPSSALVLEPTDNKNEAEEATGTIPKKRDPQAAVASPEGASDRKTDLHQAGGKAGNFGKNISFILRMRNDRHELNDIRFDFTFGKDTPQGVAEELVSSGLTDPRDAVEIAMNLTKLINGQSGDPVDPNAPKTILFNLISAGPNEQYNNKVLDGFAQLMIVD